MAVLNKIRQQSLVLILVIAMALFAFILSGIFDGSSKFSSSSQDTVATINGVDIMRDDFMRRVDNRQRQLGSRSSSVQTMNNVWNQELRKVIMKTEFEELGLSVEKDEMRELLKTNFASYPEFLNADGVFDENKLNEFIANLKEISPNRVPLGTFQLNYGEWVTNEKSIAVGAQEKAYYNMIKAGVGATVAEAEVEYMSDVATRDLSFVYVPYTTINDSLIDVSKSDISTFINAHKEDYKVDATRDINFVEFKEVASVKDEENIKNRILELLNDRVDSEERNGVVYTDSITGLLNTTNIEDFVNANSDIKYNDNFVLKSALPAAFRDSIYNLNVGEYFGPYKDANHFKLTKVIAERQLPDSVRVRHILIPHIGANSAKPDVTRTAEEAEKTADSVLTIVKANPSKFPELVTALSSDAGSLENGGEYDYHPMNQMVKPFNDFEFENEIGDIEVVKTVFGYHIIEILGQKNKSRAIKVATIAHQIEPSDETIDEVFNTVSKFEIALQDGDFQELAKERNLVVKPVNFKVLDENIPGLGNQRQIVRWAFEDGNEVGDYKRFSISGGGYVVVQLTKINKEGLMNVESASASVLTKIRKEKKAKLIRAKITATTVAEVAENQSQTRRTAAAVNIKNPTLAGAGREPLVIGAAFGLKEGETSKLIDGEKGVFLVEVTKINEGTKLDNYAAILKRLSATRAGAAQTKVYNALKEAADIEDNRSNFY